LPPRKMPTTCACPNRANSLTPPWYPPIPCKRTRLGLSSF